MKKKDAIDMIKEIATEISNENGEVKFAELVRRLGPNVENPNFAEALFMRVFTKLQPYMDKFPTPSGMGENEEAAFLQGMATVAQIVLLMQSSGLIGIVAEQTAMELMPGASGDVIKKLMELKFQDGTDGMDKLIEKLLEDDDD